MVVQITSNQIIVYADFAWPIKFYFLHPYEGVQQLAI